MKKNSKDINPLCIDFNTLKCKPIVVSVDGVDLPVKIGDTVKFTDDGIIRTVIKISISEDSKIQYLLEWFDGTSFKTDWVSANELYYTWKNLKRHNRTGF